MDGAEGGAFVQSQGVCFRPVRVSENATKEGALDSTIWAIAFLGGDLAYSKTQGSVRTPPMTANTQIEQTTLGPLCSDLIEAMDPRSDGPQLVQENRCLRAIIAELLIKNQHLRWELQRYPQTMAGS